MQIAINPVGGAVFMQYVTSPATAAQNIWNYKPSLDELPDLRHLSDIMWGAWNRDNADIRKIKYFWVSTLSLVLASATGGKSSVFAHIIITINVQLPFLVCFEHLIDTSPQISRSKA